MVGAFGDFSTLTEAFTAAAVNPTRWDAAEMDAAANAAGGFGAALLPVRGRTPTMPMSQSMLPTMDRYVREGWAHRDERYRSLPVFMRRGVACEFDFTTPEAMGRSPFYQELLRPQGLEWFAVVKVRRRRGCLGFIAPTRRPTRSVFTPGARASRRAFSSSCQRGRACLRFGFAR